MAPQVQRTAEEWFAEASRWYVEGHQGCPSCHAAHCVFRSEWGARVEYHEWPGAHDWPYWRTHAAESLAWLAAHVAR